MRDEASSTVLRYRDKLIPLQRNMLAAARGDYETGRGGFFPLIDAEQGLLQARLQLARAKADHFMALAELDRLSAGAVLTPIGVQP